MSDANAWEHVRREGATYQRYKNGVEVSWQPAHFDAAHACGVRGKNRDQSRASRSRAAFAFGNAECRWLAMVLLTWPTLPSADAVKSALKKLRRLWLERWGEGVDAWLMEMHKSGVPHFHLFVASESAFGAACTAAPTREVRRRGRVTVIYGGAVERWLVGAWLECIGALGNDAALAFNRGGIIEQVRSHDAAGRYVSKESYKREQKVLPDCYADGLGRWWYLAKRWSKKCIETGRIDPDEWPHAGPLKHVWQADDIQAALIPSSTLPAPLPASSLPTGRLYVLRRAYDPVAAADWFTRGARKPPPAHGAATQRDLPLGR